MDDTGSPLSPIGLREAFFNTSVILSDGIDAILRGVASQVSEEIDVHMIGQLRNSLFGPPGSGGMDLAAMGIQRGRDLGLPGHNQARGDLGLAPVTDYSDITSNVGVQDKLRNTYASVDDIDAFVGRLAEDHLPGAQVGELSRAALARQFQLTRDSDRFWYENGQFTDAELAEIRTTTLADLIQRNTGIAELPANVFTTMPAPQRSAAGRDNRYGAAHGVSHDRRIGQQRC